MTLTVVIRPEISDKLARQADAQGLEVSEYAASLLEEATQSLSPNLASPPVAKDMVELFAPLRGLNMSFERDRDTGRDITL